jgi:hypothetical protein
MDDLDRLYHRLLDAVRDGAPHLRERRFRLGDIPQHLLPYRLHRRDLGFESVQQYERALARLAAGERGYLSADGGVHEAFRRAAADPSTPVDQLLRTYGDSAVALAPDSRHRPDVPPAADVRADAPAPARDDVPEGIEQHTAEMAVPTGALLATRDDGPGAGPPGAARPETDARPRRRAAPPRRRRPPPPARPRVGRRSSATPPRPRAPPSPEPTRCPSPCARRRRWTAAPARTAGARSPPTGP